MKFTKILLFVFFITSLNAQQFKDMDYLFYKFKIKYTIEQLEKLKKLYEKDTTQYKLLQKVENNFMKNMPIDAYGTYTRMKLHNIIDNHFDKKPIKKEMILRADTDLNMLYEMKNIKVVKKQELQKMKEKSKQTKNILNPMGNPFANLTPDQLKQAVDLMNKQNKGF